MASTHRFLARWRPILAGAGMIATLAFSAFPSLADNWPQFRGINASGVSTETYPLPSRFSATENVAWKKEVGTGIASAIVWNDRVYVTGMTGETTFSVFCLDAASGEAHWKIDIPSAPLPVIMPQNSHASSTPATDGERIYLYFSARGLIALDAKDGSKSWEYPLPLPAYLMGWGPAVSPIVYEDLVLFNQDDDLSPYLLAIDKRTGKLRWRTERPDMLAGYSVPVLCTANGRTDVVVAGTGKLKGYDPATGKELWTCNSLLRTMMTTPVTRGDLLYVAAQSYGDTDRMLKSALLEWKDTNQDGKLTKDEVPPEFAAKFEKGDLNGDGVLVDEEIDAAFQSPENMVGGGNILQAIRGGGEGDVTNTHMVWSETVKAPSNMSSPLVVDDLLFVVKKGGISSGFLPGDGKTLWLNKRIGNLGEHYASPVAGDGKIYVAGENGWVVILAIGPELKVLGKSDLGENVTATPAIANGRIFFRTQSQLICVAEN